MKQIRFALLACVAALPLAAENKREARAHEHGVSTLELAIEHHRAELNIVSPGADIVGFEYRADSSADKDAVETAIRAFLVPENIVTLPETAECRLAEVGVRLHGGEPQEEDGPGHGEEETEHSEFHAHFVFDCEHPEDLVTIGFPFFDLFPNANKIIGQFVTETGAGTAEIERRTPSLSLNQE